MVDKYTEESLKSFMAARIGIAMDECPLKGEKFAEAVGVSKAAASKWSKTGSISHLSLLELSRVTKKPLAWFYPDYESVDEQASLDSMLEEESGNPEFLELALLKVLEARRKLSNSA